jgi:hypothetical protein
MLAAALVCALSVLPHAPPGFRHASEVEIWRLGPIDHTDVDYEVTLVNDKIRVETRVEFVERTDREWKLRNQSKPKHKIFLGHASGLWRIGDGVKVSDGWIHAWDAGEFGGGLYWFSPDGEKYRKIDGSNTLNVTKTEKGIFAFQASNHLMFGYARFIKVEPKNGSWSPKLITDMHYCPQAILFDTNRFIYAASDFVSTMELDGTQRLLYRSAREIRAGGFCQRKNGELWLGSSRSVLCLSPKADGKYSPHWFRPIKPTTPNL